MGIQKSFLRLLWMLLLSLPLVGCSSLQVGVEPTGEPAAGGTVPTNTMAQPALASLTPASSPTIPVTETLQATPAPAPALSSPWIEYRDARYGYGLAMPCWWTIYPTPMEGTMATMTLHSYDDAYAAANSVKGNWIGGEWPQGAVKMEFTVYEGAGPSQSLEAAASQALESLGNVVESADPRSLGSTPALLLGIHSTEGMGGSALIYILRLAPDQLLLVNVTPQTAMTSPDVQLILSSLALSREAPVSDPGQKPSAPIIPTPQACVR